LSATITLEPLIEGVVELADVQDDGLGGRREGSGHTPIILTLGGISDQ
jgi:hypothetical protein